VPAWVDISVPVRWSKETTVGRQRFGKPDLAAVNTHAIIKQLLDADFLVILVLSNTQYVVKGMRISVPARTGFQSKINTYVCGSQVYQKLKVLPPNLAHS
jgi:hypothetical protein